MRLPSIDKSSIPLFVIVGLILTIMVGLFLLLRSDAVEEAIKSDRILNILIIVEQEGKPVSSELFLFYPSTGRGAVLDFPADTGMIVRSVNRVDRIAAIYERGRPKAYIDEIARFLDTEIPYWIILDEEGLVRTVDLVEGLELFIPQPIDEKGPPRILLPKGAVKLDGDKAKQFAAYNPAEEDEAESAAWRQKLFQAMIRRLGQSSNWIVRREVFPYFREGLQTNLNDEALMRLVGELGKLDADRLVFQRVTGTWRTVDGKRLVFPHYDGELVRDIVKQTLNALSASGPSVGDKIYTVEILNGTALKGLASRTAEIFQSFGYDVVSVGNAEQEDVERTVVVDSFSNPEAAKNVAEVIRCRNISASSEAVTEARADFTVILGRDFNGRYCIAE